MWEKEKIADSYTAKKVIAKKINKKSFHFLKKLKILFVNLNLPDSNYKWTKNARYC